MGLGLFVWPSGRWPSGVVGLLYSRGHPKNSLRPSAEIYVALFFDVVLELQFFQILVPTWPQLGLQLGPKIALKSIQEPSKTHPKSHPIFDRIFDRFVIDFWSIFDPKIDQKSIKN